MKDGDRHNLLENVLEACAKDGYRHINARIGLKDIKGLHILERLGFHVVDVQVTLCTPDGFEPKTRAVSDKIDIRSCQPQDLEELGKIVRGVFTDTRFVVDPRYPRDKVDSLYFEWVKNSMADPEQTVFVVHDKIAQRLVGFCICRSDPDTEASLGLRVGHIDLIAIAKRFNLLLRNFFAAA